MAKLVNGFTMLVARGDEIQLRSELFDLLLDGIIRIVDFTAEILAHGLYFIRWFRVCAGILAATRSRPGCGRCLSSSSTPPHDKLNGIAGVELPNTVALVNPVRRRSRRAALRSTPRPLRA